MSEVFHNSDAWFTVDGIEIVNVELRRPNTCPSQTPFYAMIVVVQSYTVSFQYSIGFTR
jgi:hypothetical protein